MIMAQIFILKENERLTIGDDAQVLIVRIKGQQVKFGVRTPYKISVLRDDAKKGKLPKYKN
jgi:carbon storage regulator CsrA